MNLVENDHISSQVDLEAEQAEIKKIAELTQSLLHKRYTAVNKKVLRGVHPKSHGCVKATFTIDSNVSPENQIGLFSNPGMQYQAIIRFSNATALVVDDMENGKNLSRGMAIKVLDVDSRLPILQDDNGARNQDFLMINTPSFAFANVKDYLRLTLVLNEDNDRPDRFFAPLSPHATGFTKAEIETTKQSFSIIKQIESMLVADPLQVRYFGAAPFLFGKDRVMQFSVVPSDGEVPQKLSRIPSADYLRERLTERLSGHKSISFDFMVQLRNLNDSELGLENATTHWDENAHEYIKIATINIPAPQVDINTKEHKSTCENLVFTPWHCLADHEPLGGINRLRNEVYNASSSARLANQNTSQCPFTNRAPTE